MKEWFNNNILAHKKRYIVIGIVLLILVIFTAVALFTYGYFTNTSTNLILSGTAEIDTADIRLRIYLQDEVKNKPVDSYTESVGSAVDHEKYIFNPAKSVCSEGEEFVKVENGVLTISYGKKGSCSAYFDVVTKDYDIVTKVYKEKEDGSGYEYVEKDGVDTNSYTLDKDLSDCTKYGSITDDNKVSFKGIGTCEIVYKKNDTASSPSSSSPSEESASGSEPTSQSGVE